MDTPQSVSPPAESAPVVVPRSFKTPSNISFAVGVLLFLTPFVDIKCNNFSIYKVSGMQLATGFNLNANNNSVLNTDPVDQGITKTTTKSSKWDPNIYALTALAVGILGLVLSFNNTRAGQLGGIITGSVSAAALVGLFIDIKRSVRLGIPSDKTDSGLGSGDDINISVDFTPWYYIALVAFIAAAVLCYKRYKAGGT